MKHTTTLLLTSAWLSATAACGDSADPYNRLTDLRVLAIRADPPTVPLGQAATLDALVFHPEAESAAYRWSWCPARRSFEQGYECAVSAAQFQQMTGAAAAPTFELGSEPTATFALSDDAATLQRLCASPVAGSTTALGGLIDCSDGLPISIGLRLTAGDQEVRAYKTIYLALDNTGHANQNPTIDGVALAPEDSAPNAAQALAAGDPEQTVTLSEAYALTAAVPVSAAEGYLGPDGNPQRESLVLTWFVQAGSTEATRTTFIDGIVDLPSLEANTWALPEPEEYQRTRAELHLVLRDSRGGIGWLSRSVLVTE